MDGLDEKESVTLASLSQLAAFANKLFKWSHFLANTKSLVNDLS